MRVATSPNILFEALWPTASRAQNGLAVVAGCLLVALCAQIALPLPFSPVPVTGQTFAVLLVGATLGAQRGAASLLLYLTAGAAGLPVFAPVGAPGLARLVGPTGGYLLAYPLAAFVLGRLLERAPRRRLRNWLLAVAAAETLILAAGAAWLKAVTAISWSQALWQGFLPFLPGEVVKVALVGLCLPASWWAIERHRQS